MKKTYLTLIFVISLLQGYSQKTLNQHYGESFNLGQPLNNNDSYEYTASEYVKMFSDACSGFEYTPEPGQYFHAKTDPLMVFPPEENTTGGSPNNNEGGVVGTTDGSFTVSSSGAAVYSVPIKVPAGTAGMSPGLALVYNSQSDDGLLGERWTLSGLSAITVGAKLYYYDQLSEAVELPQNLGPFYLDGKRLLVVNEDTYTTEYRTEVDEFKKIIGVRYPYPSAVFKFIVYTKSGLIYEYGYTENSKHYLKDYISDIEVPLAWYVNKISDRQGNYIEFEYYQDLINGELRIKEIQYTGNTNTGLEPYNKIEFIYGEDRDEIIETNFKTNFIPPCSKFLTAKITKYLTGIKCYTVGNVLYREYDI